MKEEFRDIKGYEGYYQVSNLGRVKSLTRFVNHYTGSKRIIKERILKNKNVNGYHQVDLSKEGSRKPFNVHQLVAMAFLNHKPIRYVGLIVDHIDNNGSNNKLSNLQLITQRENLSKDKKNKTSKYTGVCWAKSHGKWKASIYKNNKVVLLGYYKNELEAYKSYLKALEK